MLTDKTKKLFKYFLPGIIKSGVIGYFPILYSRINFKPYAATLNITDKCCFKCIMCDQWKSQDTAELSLQECKEVLGQLKENNIKEIIFSGGEPFLRKDLLEVIAYAKTLNFEVSVISNGYLLQRAILNRLVELGISSIAISLDATETNFDKIRGIEGAYSKVIGICKILSEYKKNNLLDVYLYFTLMKETLGYYLSVIKIAKELELPLIVNLFDYTPYFFKSLKSSKDLFWIKDQDGMPDLKELQRLFVGEKTRDPEIVYHTYSEIDYFRKYFYDPIQSNIPCMVSQLRIGIDSKGDVYGGCWSMGIFGNLKEKKLKEIINSRRYKEAHKNMFFKKCPGCSCGYPKNLRYHLPTLMKEALFRIFPATRKIIWR